MILEIIYHNPGVTIFLVLWLFGILNYLIRQDDNLIGIAIVYSFFYAIFKLLTG